MLINNTNINYNNIILNKFMQECSVCLDNIKEKDKKLAESGAKGIVASYFFRKNSFFIKEAQKMIRDNDMVGSNNSKEFYISQVYSRLLKKKNFKTIKYKK